MRWWVVGHFFNVLIAVLRAGLEVRDQTLCASMTLIFIGRTPRLISRAGIPVLFAAEPVTVDVDRLFVLAT